MGIGMKKSFNKDSIINLGFYCGLGIKAINALVEFIGGLFMIILNHDALNNVVKDIAIPELREDPTDFIMNYLITIGQNLSISSQYSIAIYMLLHGITKLVVIFLLLKKKIWAYIPAIVIFSFFVMYEIYSYIHSQSLLMLFIIIIDVAIIAMIMLEYRHLKEKQKE